MPIPDFESIARQVAIDCSVTGITAAVAEQLRQVWNARGREDLAQLELPVSEICDAIRALDK